MNGQENQESKTMKAPWSSMVIIHQCLDRIDGCCPFSQNCENTLLPMPQNSEVRECLFDILEIRTRQSSFYSTNLKVVGYEVDFWSFFEEVDFLGVFGTSVRLITASR